MTLNRVKRGRVVTFMKYFASVVSLTLFRMCFFGAAHGWEGEGGGAPPPLPNICHTYPTMMKLGSYTLPKDDPKNI